MDWNNALGKNAMKDMLQIPAVFFLKVQRRKRKGGTGELGRELLQKKGKGRRGEAPV